MNIIRIIHFIRLMGFARYLYIRKETSRKGPYEGESINAKELFGLDD